MEHFNETDSAYFEELRKKHKVLKLKIELLSELENAIGEITKYFSKETNGQININYQQLLRRSCSLTIANIDKQYDDISWWIDRKFKLWIGLVVDKDTYWFPQGVFLTKDSKIDNHALSIEAVDKGGFLDGTIKTNMIVTPVVIEQGSNIAQFFRDTLLLNDNQNIIDPAQPIINKAFNNAIIETEIAVKRGEYVGNIFKNIADAYNADIFYDVDGHFNFEVLTEGNRGDGYNLLPSSFDFTFEDITWIQPDINLQSDYVNAVTVFTNITAKNSKGQSIPNIEYTAYNNNPISPLRISAVRIRQNEPQEIKYINVLSSRMKELCREYANYLLFKNSMIALSVSFSSQIIPHLDVNRVITITDKNKGLDMARFVIQSITIPLSAGEMSIQATNTQILPIDTNMEGGANGRLH